MFVDRQGETVCQATSFSGRFKGHLRVPKGTVECISWKSNSIKCNMLYIRRLTQGHDYYFVAEVSKNEGGSVSILRTLIVSYKTHGILQLP